MKLSPKPKNNDDGFDLSEEKLISLCFGFMRSNLKRYNYDIRQLGVILLQYMSLKSHLVYDHPSFKEVLPFEGDRLWINVVRNCISDNKFDDYYNDSDRFDKQRPKFCFVQTISSYSLYHCYQYELKRLLLNKDQISIDPTEETSQTNVELLKNYYDINGIDTRRHESYCLSFAKSTIDYSKYKYNQSNLKTEAQESKQLKQLKQIQIEQSSTDIVDDTQEDENDDEDEEKDKDKDNNTMETQESKESKESEDGASKEDESEFIGVSGVRGYIIFSYYIEKNKQFGDCVLFCVYLREMNTFYIYSFTKKMWKWFNVSETFYATYGYRSLLFNHGEILIVSHNQDFDVYDLTDMENPQNVANFELTVGDDNIYLHHGMVCSNYYDKIVEDNGFGVDILLFGGQSDGNGFIDSFVGLNIQITYETTKTSNNDNKRVIKDVKARNGKLNDKIKFKSGKTILFDYNNISKFDYQTILNSKNERIIILSGFFENSFEKTSIMCFNCKKNHAFLFRYVLPKIKYNDPAYPQNPCKQSLIFNKEIHILQDSTQKTFSIDLDTLMWMQIKNRKNKNKN